MGNSVFVNLKVMGNRYHQGEIIQEGKYKSPVQISDFYIFFPVLINYS